MYIYICVCVCVCEDGWMWVCLNEVSRRKSTAKAKLKAASQQESKTVGTAFQKSTRKPTENNG